VEGYRRLEGREEQHDGGRHGPDGVASASAGR